MKKYLNNIIVTVNIIKRKIKSIFNSLKTFFNVLDMLTPLVELLLFIKRSYSNSEFAFFILSEIILSLELLNLFL